MKHWHQVLVWLAMFSIVAWFGARILSPGDATPLVRQADVAHVAASEREHGPALPRDAKPPEPIPVPRAAVWHSPLEPGPLGEWETFQRDARHTGYVPATFNPALFAEKWQWQRPSGGVNGGINAVATAPGYVVVSDDEYFGSPAVRVLDEVSGEVVWQQVFENFPALNPPAAANGAVYVATTGHEKTFLWAFGVADGAPVFQAEFAAQWHNLLAPTAHGDEVFVGCGYFGNVVYSFDAAAGDQNWWAPVHGGTGMSTPAIDGGRVFQYNGTTLDVLDAESGGVLASIPNPNTPNISSGITYHGAPMLGKHDSVTVFNGDAISGYASSNIEHGSPRELINFSIEESKAKWQTSRRYMTHPATAGGVIYAGSNNPKSFDAIDEATGRVLWSWVPGTEDLSFHRNVVVTDNLVFVSTNRAVYALDIATRRPVWSYPVPGMLAISGGGTLYIMEGAGRSTGRLIAIALNGRWIMGGPGHSMPR